MFLLASRGDWGITFFRIGCIIWVTSAVLRDARFFFFLFFFSPKPHFVYKWWLYVKTFCLSWNQCLGSLFLLDTCTLTSQTYTQHTLLYCLVHCNMKWVFLLQFELKPLHFSLSSVYVRINPILSCTSDLKHFATWRCKASCINYLQSIWACR